MKAQVFIGILVVATFLMACAPPAPIVLAGLGPAGIGSSAAPQQCKTAIDYKTLIAALPKDTAGFTAGTPDGTTLSWNDPTNTSNVVQYSTASVTLTKDEQSIEVTAVDTCYVQFLSAAWMGYVGYEGTQGYLRKTTVGGQPAWQQYDASSSMYSVHVLVNNRVFVSTQGNGGASESDVGTVANAVDYASIASAATS